MTPNSNSKRYSARQILKFIKEKKEGFWLREREKRSLDLFHNAASRVPAYKDFLRKNRVSPDRIKTWDDFSLIPPTSKKDYLQQYPLKDLCWDGILERPLVFCSTSGSTGTPYYFPRDERLDWQSSFAYELFLQNSLIEKGPVLAIVCFGMGVWIGGLIAYKSLEIFGRRGEFPISIITPGINKREIFNALKNLAPNFKQVVLAGYPPFIKDIVDEAEEHDIDLERLNIRFLFAAEPFTESFRDYLVKKAHVKNLYLDNLHIYGSADIGTMAWEVGAAVLIKRLALKNMELFKDIFQHISKIPTLAQYCPFFINFEVPGGEILLTGDNTVPLVRYSIGDRGGVFTLSEMVSKLKSAGYDFGAEAKEAGIERYIYELPFVYVYERTDLSTTLYGLQIYPEIIRDALHKEPACNYLTGKFSMLTKYSENQDQYLEINLELKKNIVLNDEIKKIALDGIFQNLLKKSSEYNELYAHLKDRALPKMVYWPAEHPSYFKPGIKNKWVINNA